LDRRDRRLLVEQIVRAGFVDLTWLRAATGRQFDSPTDAAGEYLDGLLPVPLSPLLAGPDRRRPVESVAGARAAGDDGDPLVRYLRRDNPGYLPVPVFDDGSYRQAHPEAIESPGRARGHFLAAVADDQALPVPADWAGPVPQWGAWRQRMLKLAAEIRGRDDALPMSLPETEDGDDDRRPWSRPLALAERLIDWTALERGLPGRRADLVSVLIPTIDDWRLTNAAVGAVLRNSGGHDIEIVIVDNGSQVNTAIGLAQAVAGRDPGGRTIRVVWMPENLNFALGTNLAFARSSGSRVVLLNNDTEVQPGWLDPLLDELADPHVAGVQPLLLYGDGTIQTAGTSFPDCGGLPSHLLVEHPAEDARRLGRFDVSAVTAAAMAMRASDYCRLRGLDPRFINGYEDVDLCLRAVTDPGFATRFRVATDAVVLHFESRTRVRTVVESNRAILWREWRGRLPAPDTAGLLAEAGFEVIRWDPGVVGKTDRGRIPAPVVQRRVARLRERSAGAADRPSLRFAIKAPWSFTGIGVDGVESWRPVVAELAELLRSDGDFAAIDAVEAHQRRTIDLDDVVVVLGSQPGPFQVQPGRPNLLVRSERGEVEPGETEPGETDALFDEVLWLSVGADSRPTSAALAELAGRLVDTATTWWRDRGTRIGLAGRRT